MSQNGRWEKHLGRGNSCGEAQRQHVCAIPLTCNVQRGRARDTEVGGWLPRSGWNGNGLLSGGRVSFWGDEHAWEAWERETGGSQEEM